MLLKHKSHDDIKFDLLILGTMLGTFSWLPGMPMALLAVIKGSVFFLLVVDAIKKGQLLVDRLLPFILIYAALLAVPFVNSVIDIGFSQVTQVSFWVIPILMIIIMTTVDSNARMVSSVFTGFVYAGLLHAFWVIFTYLLSYNPSPESIVGSGLASRSFSVMGFANSHTMASPLLGISGGIVLFSSPYLIGPISKVSFRLYILSFLLLAQVLTGGEGGLLVYLAAVAGVFIFKYFKKPLTIALLAMSSTYLAFNIVGPYLSESLYASYLEHQISNSAGFEMFLNNPVFGVGFNQSYQYFNDAISTLYYSEKLYSESLTPHTPYGMLMSEAGLFGLIALLVLLYTIARAITNVSYEDDLGKASYFVLLYFLLLSFLEPWPMVSNFYALYVFYAALIYLFSFTTDS